MRPSRSTPGSTPSARTPITYQESEEPSAEHPLVKSIMSNIEAEADTTKRPTSNLSAADTTIDDMPTGDETPDILLTLPRELWLKWLLRRLSNFQFAVVDYAESAKRNRETVRSASEAEWQALIETNGITRAVPNEQEVYKWVLNQVSQPSPSPRRSTSAPTSSKPDSGG